MSFPLFSHLQLLLTPWLNIFSSINSLLLGEVLNILPPLSALLWTFRHCLSPAWKMEHNQNQDCRFGLSKWQLSWSITFLIYNPMFVSIRPRSYILFYIYLPLSVDSSNPKTVEAYILLLFMQFLYFYFFIGGRLLSRLDMYHICYLVLIYYVSVLCSLWSTVSS